MWQILADGRRYADWVVGASHVREVEPSWPSVGSRFHHTVGIWPLHLRDTTAVEECDVGHRLVLEARARPFGRARVEIALEEIPTGTRIVMSEEARSPSIARWSNPVLAPLIHVRNVEALRRLAALCEKSAVLPATCDGSDYPRPNTPESALDKELADSFPASDPPSSWGGTT
ncbi:MAG: SRPBCC family protein [Actinomycetota bacterium]|nr:SRPBCC family protein [Actinomycetota bacterium]